MGENSTETVEEIEVLRDRLDGEVKELEARLPAPARWTRQLAGVAVGGGLGGSVLWFAVRKIKTRKASKPEASEPVQAVIRLLPEDVADDLARQVARVVETGAWRPWAGGIAALWLVTRLAELRALRRLAAAHA
ncbi:MAG: hypothetical protein M3357_12240 [Actinomycetota bacterium]|nr:hypothetical protein [Actinomycetota bacterium]